MLTLYLATPFRFRTNPYLVGFNEIDSHIRDIKLLRGQVYEHDVDIARNILVDDFLEKTNGIDDVWLCFIDDDILLPDDIFDLFLKEKEKYKTTKFFYGEYCLKKASYESAHIIKNNKAVTIASGLNFIHKDIFVHLKRHRIVSGNINSLRQPYQWYICGADQNNNKTKSGEDSYFTSLVTSQKFEIRKISDLIGLHVDFKCRSIYGPEKLVRNGKIKYDHVHKYSISKDKNPIYYNICENEINIERFIFKETKAFNNIAVLTPRRFESTPMMSNLHLNPMRNKNNINMYFYTLVETPRDIARNQLVENVLNTEKKLDYIFFLDDDNIVDYDAIDILLSYNEPVIGFNYCLKKPHYESVHLMDVPVDNISSKQLPIPKDEKEGLVEIKRVIGLGATLIKAEVFKSINRPWFQEYSDDYINITDDKKVSFTDDTFFTNLLVKNNIIPKVIAHKHSAHIDFETFNVYGHPSIVNNQTAKLKNRKDIRWALSEEHKRELIEKE